MPFPTHPLATISESNPFYFPFEPSLDRSTADINNLTVADYVTIQNAIRKINITDLLLDMYQDIVRLNLKALDTSAFALRCNNGLRQHLIDVDAGFFPIEHHIKLGTCLHA